MGTGLPDDLRALLRLSPDADPVCWLLAADEPAARWVLLTGVLGAPQDADDVRRARAAVLTCDGTRELLERLPDWETPSDVGGHNSPRYAPNLLGLLSDMGVGPGDDARVEALLDAFVRHERDGRFYCLAQWRGTPAPVWGTLPCDTHIIADVLVRFGRDGDEAVLRSLARIAADLTETAQGPGWKCLPDPQVKFRGPGRVADVCPVVSLQALRLFARLPGRGFPGCAGGASSGAARSVMPDGRTDEPDLLGAARTVLRAWRERGAEKPYMFGHGRGFKTVKWYPSWYDVLLVLDTVGRYPEVWSRQSATAADEDRRAVAELAACLIAYNIAPDGTVTPQSCYKGYEGFSFGQKKRPSPLATARLLTVVRRFGELADEIAAIDVRALTSSKGGTGRALPPRLPGRA
jgi:hypothetical protein